MVIYFSATGNTEFVAREIASRIGDECLNLLGKIKDNDLSPLSSDKPWIICSPVYVCEMPRFLVSFLSKLPLEGSREAYMIFTSGGYAGCSGPLCKSMLRKKGLTVKGYTDFAMPRNYPVSKKYDMLERDEIESRLDKSYQRFDEVAGLIKAGEKLPHRYVFLLEKAVTLPFNPVWCKNVFKSDDFVSSDACIGCGLCARMCPLNNIKITDGKPVWGTSCTHCMACLGNCPKEAIEYGDRTVDKSKYNLKRYKYFVDELKGK